MPKRITLEKFVARISEQEEWQTSDLLEVIEEMSARKSRAKSFKRTDKAVPAEGLCKQARAVASALEAGDVVDYKTWAEKAIENGLETTQDPQRIVAYYKADLLEQGLIVEA